MFGEEHRKPRFLRQGVTNGVPTREENAEIRIYFTYGSKLRRLLLYPLSYGAERMFKITKNSSSIQQHHEFAIRHFVKLYNPFPAVTFMTME